MKYFARFILIGLFLLPISSKSQTFEEEVQDAVNNILVPIIVKQGFLAVQKSSGGKKNIIILCKQGPPIELTYELLLSLVNEPVPTIKDFLLNTLLPNLSPNGEVLLSKYDQLIIREINQFIEFEGTITEYGLNMIGENELVKVYLSPETTGGILNGTLMEALESVGVEENTLESRYGDIIGSEYQTFLDSQQANYSEAVDEMTNFYSKMNDANLAKYNEYLETVMGIAQSIIDN